MTLSGSFFALANELHKLSEAIESLRVTIGDHPAGEPGLYDDLENAALNLLGGVASAREVLRNQEIPDNQQLNLLSAKNLLISCERRFRKVEREFWSGIAGYETLHLLATFSTGEEKPWAAATRVAIEECKPGIGAVSAALFECWQEITDVAIYAAGIPRYKEK